ncbi:MAG: DNA recombination protein RmuC [Clostridiales bacterium]|nr:DNA recombination protein RmuC [Clostridiales bacterium]
MAMETIIILVLLVINVALIIFLILKKGTSGDDVKKENNLLRRMISEEFQQSRQEISKVNREDRQEQYKNFESLSKSIFERWTERNLIDSKRDEAGAQRISNVAKDNEIRMTRLEEQVSKRLDEMRKTVDEQLNETLQKRVSASFEQVTKQLTQLYSSLSKVDTDMASLQKVFSGVKTRGVWGEIMLIALLEQILTPQQFVKNAKINPNKQNYVEVAVRMPGNDGENDVLLPIDSKFPVEDYQRLIDARENGDKVAELEADRALTARIKSQAKDIRDKYIDPPYSTDFAIMYLPAEGLFAEALRVPGLTETLQVQYKVTVCGPTTLAALLNSLKMGFTTLAIQKKSGEVWRLLAAVKKTINIHQSNLQKAYRNMQTSVNALDDAQKNIGTINNRLRSVEEIPTAEVDELIPGIKDESGT